MLSEYATIIKTILYRNLVEFLSSVVMSRVTLFKNIFSNKFWFSEQKKRKITKYLQKNHDVKYQIVSAQIIY